MDDQPRNIEPSKVTKPIQLLAAWLAGLVLINGSFLATASATSIPAWGAGMLLIAAVANVPIFLASLFLMQTRFRPEMQEDQYYAKYLEKRFSVETQKSELVAVHSKGDEGFKALIQIQLEEIQKARAALEAEIGPKLSALQATPSIPSFTAPPSAPITSTRFPTSVELNDLLPDIVAVERALNQAGVMINKVFGSTNPQPIEAPAHFVLSFGDRIDVALFQNILRAIKDNGLEYISHVGDEISNQRIYIGSYAYRVAGRPLAKASTELIEKLLQPDATMSAIREIVKANSNVVHPR